MTAVISRVILLRLKGRRWFEERFLPAFHPVTVVALLATLVLIFAFQADNLTSYTVEPISRAAFDRTRAEGVR